MMEKVSIVRRRLEMPPTQAELRANERAQSPSAATSTAVLPEPAAAAFAMPVAPAGSLPASEVAVDLTPEARAELWSGGHLAETSADKRHFIVEAEKVKEDGRVVLKLQFMKPDFFLRLLTTEEVCEMLHVSRSSLYQYANSGELRTFRMGRSLRFRFQDVLEFLTGTETRKE